MEFYFKWLVLRQDKQGISARPPLEYAERFQSALKKKMNLEEESSSVEMM